MDETRDQRIERVFADGKEAVAVYLRQLDAVAHTLQVLIAEPEPRIGQHKLEELVGLARFLAEEAIDLLEIEVDRLKAVASE